MTNRIIDEDEDAAKAGISSLAEALRRQERRRHLNGVLFALTILALVGILAFTLYTSQVNQIDSIKNLLYENCQTRNQQLSAERALIDTMGTNSEDPAVRKAASDALAALPDTKNCSVYVSIVNAP